jgi:hypothetical protein
MNTKSNRAITSGFPTSRIRPEFVSIFEPNFCVYILESESRAQVLIEPSRRTSPASVGSPPATAPRGPRLLHCAVHDGGDVGVLITGAGGGAHAGSPSADALLSSPVTPEGPPYMD